MDISSPTTKSFRGRHHWLLVFYNCTDCCRSYFLKEKSDLKDKKIDQIKELDSKHNYKVKYICCDNSGENISFKKVCKQEGLRVTFECTAPKTPQQNGRVEREFATLYCQVRAMLNGGKFDSSMRNQLWVEAAKTATMLQSIKRSFHQLFGNGRTNT